MKGLQELIGYEFEPTTFRYTESDAIRYALGIGAGQDPVDPDELRFVYENAPAGFRVFPTFATTFGQEVMWQILALPGVQVNPMMLLHGEHRLSLPGPLPDSATIKNEGRIAAIYDKGSGALFHLEVRSKDEQAREIAFNRYSVFVRGLGGFGGERGPSGKGAMPERAPDGVHRERIPANQALLYRLSGDRNPLHADPRMARIAGFEQPILHGLSTFGSAVRALLGPLTGQEPERFRGAQARFSRHIFPGETLVTEMWAENGGEIRFQCRVAERDEIALANGTLTLG